MTNFIMTVMVFLIDNSVSMSQRTYLGTSLLDVAKGCVEDIYKIRLKSSRSDRYYVYSLQDEDGGGGQDLKPHECKQNLHMIRAALDVIKPRGYSNLGVGIRRTFDMLNLLRMTSGYENYGMGRYPSQSDHAIVVCITDGGRLTSEAGLLGGGDLNLPVLSPTVPGHEYTAEPFRWDYRLYSIVLRLPGFIGEEVEVPKFIATDEECPISAMCEVTGGRAYKITNERMLHQCLESLSQKCHPGVVLHFMKLDEINIEINKSEVQRWHTCKKMIYVKASSVGAASSHWPIPESFWPDEHLNDKLPPRTAHPIVCFSTTKMPVPKIMDHFPLDKYELEPSPLTQYILERRDSNFVWHCYVPKSGKSQDYPFGYLKPSVDLQSVHLYVLSYNFPALIDLLNNLSDTFKMRINDIWGSKFAHYLGIIPKYYFSPLSRAFERIGLPYLIKQDNIEKILPFNLKSNLQKLRQMAKMQHEADQRVVPSIPKTILFRNAELLKRSHSRISNQGDVTPIQMISVKMPRLDMRSYFVPSKVDRSQLRTMLSKSINNFKEYSQHNVRLMERESINEQPMSEMGDYANYKYCSLLDPLKEINPAPERKETFGNPFRRKTPSNAFEADEKFVEDMSVSGQDKMTKRPSISEMGRSKGALPLNVTYYNWRRTPCPSPTISDMHDGSDNEPSPKHSPFSKEVVVESKTLSLDNALKDQYQYNKNISKKLITILRHPKIDGAHVFKLLTKFKGPYKLQHTMISRCVQQAVQFKRQKISQLMSQYLTHLNTRNVCPLINGH